MVLAGYLEAAVGRFAEARILARRVLAAEPDSAEARRLHRAVELLAGSGEGSISLP